MIYESIKKLVQYGINSGLTPESERIYNYLIDKMPRDWILYEGRADLYFLMGKNARAMSDINRIFVESTPNASLYILRGKVKLAQYEKESAKKDFLKCWRRFRMIWWC